jgi:hypothetical protein
MAGSIMAKVKPEGGIEDESQEGVDDPGVMAGAEDLISAIHMKDAKATADALMAIFEIYESKPHEEAGEEGEAKCH